MNERALKLLEDLAASPEGSQASLASTLHKAPPHALDLIRRMLTFNMTKRITAEAALTHPFIKLTGEAQTAEQLGPVLDNVSDEIIGGRFSNTTDVLSDADVTNVAAGGAAYTDAADSAAGADSARRDAWPKSCRNCLWR